MNSTSGIILSKKSLSNKILKHKVFQFCFVTFFCLLTLALFFRGPLLSPGKAFFDNWDGLIALSTIHHWYNVIHGIDTWNTLSYFYPYENTLGYSEAFLIHGIFYSFFKLLHFNPFISMELAIVVIRMIGFYSFFYLSFKKLNFNFYISVLTSAIFTLSNSAFTQDGHTQNLSVSLAPLLTIFILNYFENLIINPSILKGVFWGTMAGLLYVVWLFSCFYMAWFFTLFTFLLLVFLFCFKFFNKLEKKKPYFISIILPVVFTFIALLPFLRVYIPMALETGMQQFSAAFDYTPTLKDIINLGQENLIWGHILHRFSFAGGEFSVGFPFLFMGVLLFALYYSINFFRKEKIASKLSVFWISLSFAIILSIFLSIKISSFDPWFIIWKFFPGAKGLRVVARYWIFLVYPMCLLIAYFLSNKFTKMNYAIRFFIFAILLLEQTQTISHNRIDIKEQMDFLDSVKNPPAQCKSFFAVESRYSGGENPLYRNNVDAFLISEFLGIRTLNGFNTFNPPDWDFSYEPSANYINRVKEYVAKHKIENNLCVLNIKERKWDFYNLSKDPTLINKKN